MFNTIEELAEITNYSVENTRLVASELYHHAITKVPPVPPEWAQHVVTATLPDTELSRLYSTWYISATEADRTHTNPGLSIIPSCEFAQIFGPDSVLDALGSLLHRGRPMHFTGVLCISEHRLPGAVVHGGMYVVDHHPAPAPMPE